MQYLKHERWNELKHKYDHILAWGTGWTLKWDNIWQEMGYEALIDGSGRLVGSVLEGHKIEGIEWVSSLKGRVLAVIYSCFEQAILNDIQDANIAEIDTIFYKLVDLESEANGQLYPQLYAKNGEDLLILNQMAKFRISVPQYLEIGVLHPICRNNTFLLNQLYSNKIGYKGVLVEANPMCWPLIETYRKEDILVRVGVANTEGEMKFNAFPTKPGLSTFNEERAERVKKWGVEFKEYIIQTVRIDRLIEENYSRTPDILSIDAEGLDYDILSDLDMERYPIKIILCEVIPSCKDKIEKLMLQNGYRLSATTWENQMWVHGDLWKKD